MRSSSSEACEHTDTDAVADALAEAILPTLIGHGDLSSQDRSSPITATSSQTLNNATDSSTSTVMRQR